MHISVTPEEFLPEKSMNAEEVPSDLLDAWRRQLANDPTASAIHYFDVSLSFGELDRAADALASALLDEGVQAGDRLAIFLQNDPQWLVSLVAAWKIGLVAVAVNPMARGKELLHLFTDSAATAVVAQDALYARELHAIRDKIPARVVVTTHPLDMTPRATVPEAIGRNIPAPVHSDGVLRWSDVMATHVGRSVEAAGKCPEAVALLTYTSGTTGPAKGAINVHRSMVGAAQVYIDWWDIRRGQDVVLCVAPITHITGSVAGAALTLVSGAPMVLMHRMDPETVLALTERWRATFVVAVSTAYSALSSSDNRASYDVSSLTKTLSGGAPLSAALARRVFDATGWNLHSVYGMTEAHGPTHLVPDGAEVPIDPESGALSVGVTVPGFETRIVDVVSGSDLSVGELGEIVIRGPGIIPGYWELPEETAHAIRDGWHFSGDLGRVDENGWLFVVDRLKDIIVAGGFKIYPRDVEDILQEHPAVKEVSVVGIPDEYRGETVKAYVSVIGGVQVSSEELIAFCRERMAAYKYPRLVEFMDELPRNASGKLLRRELRAR
ncbi:long-chain fatty acid--CoA ligase [Rhodococcus sp. MS16]|uniref:class I adenylate-forming enzyme family protein n=1 Tax=Rhodococcus TaxID=1827 RepID=UPI001562C441|nr:MULTISPECIES: AMP-binding protein [Rhodococcus]MCE4267554.1 AMP-binding protein [Rhodococcus globerulus]NRI68710.1 long-chain fatty acid--CoA ligase [Rhodococcus sp. MS16]